MAWIESHQELLRHPKLTRFADAAGVDIPAAIGYLHIVWWWALSYADDGDLSSFTAKEVAVGGEWRGDPAVFVAALKQAGFIDDDDTLHDWWDYAGKLVERRQKDRERKQDVRRKSAGRRKDGVRTQPNPTQPTKPKSERTELKDAIAAWWTGTDPPFELTSSEWGRVERAAKELADLGASPNDVADRGSRWWKDMTKSPQGLVNNWSQLVPQTHVCEFKGSGVWGAVCECGKRKEDSA